MKIFKDVFKKQKSITSNMTKKNVFLTTFLYIFMLIFLFESNELTNNLFLYLLIMLILHILLIFGLKNIICDKDIKKAFGTINNEISKLNEGITDKKNNIIPEYKETNDIFKNIIKISKLIKNYSEDIEIWNEELIKSERSHKLILDNSPVGISQYTINGKINYANIFLAKMYGYSSTTEFMKKSLKTLYANKNDRFYVSKYLKSNKALHGYETKMLKKDGSVFDANLTIIPFFSSDGEIMYYECYTTDISNKKEIANIKIEKDAAEASNKAKSMFLATMSHEIRTPLNGVLGFADLLKDTNLNLDQQKYVQTITDSGQHLLTVINDILDFSKIEAGKLEFENKEFNLHNTVTDVKKMMTSKAIEKGIKMSVYIDIDTPARVIGDPSRLRQILFNLIGNAIKFTDKNGTVEIKVKVERENETDAKIRFEISDTGIGIDDKTKKKLFKPFTQADASTKRKYGGTGLGLSISAQLVRIMQGEIDVNSIPEKGSTFWFTAMLKKSKMEVSSKIKEEIIPEKTNIMLVDDQEINRNLYYHLIHEKWGFNCTIVKSVDEAINTLESVNSVFDLVITDYTMPKKDGSELCLFMKNDIRFKDVKRMIFTSTGIPGESDQMLKMGFNAYLVKGQATRSDLYNIIMQLLTKDNKDDEIITRHSIIDTKTQLHVLVAEDNKTNQQLIVKYLEKFGHTTIIANNGKEAVSLLSSPESHFDIVIMDVQMPEMDGREATRVIRDYNSKVINHNIPIIGATAHAMDEEKKECIESGMDLVVTKPLNPKILKEAIIASVSDKNKK